MFVLDVAAFAFKDTQESRETLQGVAPVYVVIEGITPALNQNGVSADQIKTDVELQLKEAGIDVIATVVGRESPELFPAGLYVRSNALKSNILKSEFNIDYYAISISVELIQHCLPLSREFTSRISEKDIDPSYINSHSASACTWSRNNIYLAGEERIIAIRDCVQDLVGHFIDAYVSVNPKRQ